MADTAAPKSRKPKESAFSQQRLPACQPILTAGCVLPIFLVIGVTFVGLGILLYLTANSVTEYIYRYTDCINNAGVQCKVLLDQDAQKQTTCTCNINFELNTSFTGDVYVYYGLENFYQNHRRYVKSRDANQLVGKTVTAFTIAGECEPFRLFNGTPIAPCGAIANSLFNDTITLTYNNSLQLKLHNQDIAWYTDRTAKYKNPEPVDNLSVAFAGYAIPYYWKKPVYMLDPEHVYNNGYKNQDLMVWMRTAALPSFRKLWRIIRISDNPSGLQKGSYVASINYNFPVQSFEGEKFFVLTTITWIGGRNIFLGLAYIVVGSLCILLTLIFFVINLKMGKRMLRLSGRCYLAPPLKRYSFGWPF